MAIHDKKTLLESFGIEQKEPSRFDPEKHNPEWGLEVDAELYDALISLNPCPVPVAGKLAMRVRFTLNKNGDEEHARRVEKYERDLVDYEERGRLGWKPSPPTRHYFDALSSRDDHDGSFLDPEVNCSDPVLAQYMREGGWVLTGHGNCKTKIPVLHLGGFGLNDWGASTLCGRHGRPSYLASYAGDEDQIEPYKVCSHCRRVAEARFKRKTKKRVPKGPTPAQLKARADAQLKARAELEAKQGAKWAAWKQDRIDRRLNNCRNMRAIAERHYTEKADGSRDRFLEELVQYITTGEMP